MPAVKVELLSGKDAQILLQLKDLVMDAVAEALQLPANDRNIRILEYPQGMFQMKPPYEIFVEILMFTGRSKETKKKIFSNIARNLESSGIIDKEKVLITLNEKPMENWGYGEVSLPMNLI